MIDVARELTLQADYAGDRRMWMAGFKRWLAAGRPASFELRAEDAAPPNVGGQRDGCWQPGACRSRTADLCRACAATASRRAA